MVGKERKEPRKIWEANRGLFGLFLANFLVESKWQLLNEEGERIEREISESGVLYTSSSVR